MKIAIIAKPRDWKVALQEIADLDQISPEYGGEGKPQKDLPSLADALYAAGNTGGGRRGITRAFTVKPSTFAMPGDIVARGDGAAGLGALPRGTSTAGESKYEQDASLVETGGRVPENEAFRNRSRRREFAADDDVEGAEDSGRGGHGWLGSAWDTVGWMFGGWNGGAGASDGDDGGMRYKRDRDMSNATHDEEVSRSRGHCHSRRARIACVCTIHSFEKYVPPISGKYGGCAWKGPGSKKRFT